MGHNETKLLSEIRNMEEKEDQRPVVPVLLPGMFKESQWECMDEHYHHRQW